MYSTRALAKVSSEPGFQNIDIKRNLAGPDDVTIEIYYCGICHSDVNFANNPATKLPYVPGHEIAGVVSNLGEHVTGLQVGDSVGVGCISDSCLSCESCSAGDEHECIKGFNFTCNSQLNNGHLKTEQGWSLGGFSQHITVHSRFVVRIPTGFPLHQAGPILCSGISTYSPLVRWGAAEGGKRVGVVGLGGLGQMGVALAAAMGNTVTAVSTSANKEKSARELGAQKFLVWSNKGEMEKEKATLDIIINTVSAPHNIEDFLPLLDKHGVIVQIGIVAEPHQVHQNPLIFRRLAIAGSMIGGMKETQEVMDFCASKGVMPNVKVINGEDLDAVFTELTGKNTAMVRYVLDVKNSLK